LVEEGTSEDVVIGVLYPQDDLGTGALDRGVYSSGGIILTLINSETSEMGGLNSTLIMSYMASKEEAVAAYKASAEVLEHYLNYVNTLPTAGKETIFDHVIEEISALKTLEHVSCLTFIENLVDYYVSSSQ